MDYQILKRIIEKENDAGHRRELLQSLERAERDGVGAREWLREFAKNENIAV